MEEGSKYFADISSEGKSTINISTMNTEKPNLQNNENETSITNKNFADENKPHNEVVNYKLTFIILRVI
ncbi:MAG: hypothetical protein PHT02_07380 [Tissierellia bacterium]|nr:hypothetical protein [Tissierellia bacterium]